MENAKIVVTVEDIEARGDEIFELCRQSNQPIFIARDGVVETVLMSLNYYKEQHFDEVWPIPPEIDAPTP